MYNEKTGNYITPVGRASFPKLHKPAPVGKNPGPDAPVFYQLTIIFDKEAQKTQDYKDLLDAVEKAIEDKWGDNRPRKVRSPFLTIDDLKNKVPAGYGTEEDGFTFIRLKSEIPVGVVKKTGQGNERLEGKAIQTELYAGCDVKAAVNVYAWNHETGGPGVSFGLSNVMKVSENEPFGATQADAADDFGEAVTGGADDDFND